MSRAFPALFDRWSRRVSARFALGHVLAGATIGLALGAGVSAACWKTRHGALRPAGALVGLLGAAAGAAVAKRRRIRDLDVALFLDARLGSDEAITTALELAGKSDGSDDAARVFVTSQATAALERATLEALDVRVVRPWHAVALAGAGAIAWLGILPLPPAPAAPSAAPGVEGVRLARVAGLEKVMKLGDLRPRDEAQRERLRRLAKEAEALRDKLRSGIEKREAQADLGKLADGITAERLSLGDGVERQGMESALGKLGENKELRSAQKALGDRDLVRLDEEMERLADRLEKADRTRAQEALEDAAQAALRAGAPNVARALDAERKLLGAKGDRRDMLRELAKELGDALGEEGKRALQELGSAGGDETSSKLADRLDKALRGMTPEQRKRLAENLKKRMGQAPEQNPRGLSKRELGEMLGELDDGRLEEELRRMAAAPAEGTEEGERQRGLDGAQGGAEEAAGELGGGLPMPMAGEGIGNGKAASSGGGAGGPAMAGHTEGGGPGSHDGRTGAVEGGEMRARATGRMNAGTPMPGVVMGRTAGRAGETANERGVGVVGAAAPGEIGGVERSDVPEEYREHVGRYFQPK
jgi:hypothetical protein